MKRKMLIKKNPGLQIYRMGSLSFLPIKTLFVLEECWSVDITSNKIRFTAEVLINAFEKHWGKAALSFVYFLILKKQYNPKSKAHCTWEGMQDEKETESV